VSLAQNPAGFVPGFWKNRQNPGFHQIQGNCSKTAVWEQFQVTKFRLFYIKKCKNPVCILTGCQNCGNLTKTGIIF
jgi:hypothetical protein